MTPPFTWSDYRWAAALAIAFLALALFRLEAPAGALFDEIFHARSGMQLAAGHMPSELTHPPLVKDFIAASIRLTGVPIDAEAHRPISGGPLNLPGEVVRAWRLPSVVAGALAVGLVYLLALALLGCRWQAGAAAALLALDGCFFVHARLAQTNVFEVAFVLAAALGAWQAAATGKDRWLVLAGLAVGGAMACRWSSASSILVLGAWLAWRWRDEPGRLVRLAAAWTVLPLAVYAAAYAPLVAAEGSLVSPARWWVVLVESQFLMYSFHAGIAEVHAYQSPWWSWPLMMKPVWYGFWIKSPTVTGVWAIGNAAVWWASVPALAAAAHAGRKGQAGLGFVALLGFGAWLAWAVQPRSLTFMHYYLTTIPFACIALAGIGGAWWRGVGVAGGPAALEGAAARVVVCGFAVAAVAWFAFYYPLLSAWPVSETVLKTHVWFGDAWL